VRSNSNQGNEEKNPCLTKCPSVLELEVVPELQSPVLKINSVPELATACLRKIKKCFNMSLNETAYIGRALTVPELIIVSRLK
jgi:hypothetical protein